MSQTGMEDNLYTADQFIEIFGSVIADALKKLRELPPQQKTGKWIGNEFGECSVCGHKGCASDIWDRCEKHYCPNCGTLLGEEQ